MRTVRPFALIPNFNQFKDVTACLRSSLQLHILNKFFLQRCPKTFHHCVVIKPPARHAYGTQRLRSYSPQARNKNCVSASASHSKSTLDFEHSILGVSCWQSQTAGSATSTCNPTANGVNGNAKIFRHLARRQAFKKNKIDGGLTKLRCVLTQSDQE